MSDADQAFHILKTRCGHLLFSGRQRFMERLQERASTRELTGLIAWPDVLWWITPQDIISVAKEMETEK